MQRGWWQRVVAFCCLLTRVSSVQATDSRAMRPSKNQAIIDALAMVIKQRRAELGYTQEDLAAQAQIDRPYLSLMEVGRKQPSLSVLARLAGGMGLGLGELGQRIQAQYERAQAPFAWMNGSAHPSQSSPDLN